MRQSRRPSSSWPTNPQITQVVRQPDRLLALLRGLAGPDGSHLDSFEPDGTVACSLDVFLGRSRAAYAGLRGCAERSPVRPSSRRSSTGQPVRRPPSAPLLSPDRKGIVAGFVDLDLGGAASASLYGGGHPVEFLITTGQRSTVIARSVDPRRWAGASLAGTAFVRDAGSGRAHATWTGSLGSTARRRCPVRAGGSTSVMTRMRRWRAQRGSSTVNSRSSARSPAVLVAAWFVFRSLAVPFASSSGAVCGNRRWPDVRTGRGVRTGGSDCPGGERQQADRSPSTTSCSSEHEPKPVSAPWSSRRSTR